MWKNFEPAFARIPASLRAQTYLVGGAVRDTLLELPVQECDWVVVGSSEQALLDLGFVATSAGAPVYLHPETGEEFALARRERSTAPGYAGFAFDANPDVSLEEDLRRRDFTVNAMALSHRGELIDPFDGQADLADSRLRHITPAFAEDPLRILRAARFAAKLGSCGFRLAHPTNKLMRAMVAEGAVSHWQPQRTWRELKSALATDHPWRFFEVLNACDALADWLPCLSAAMQQGGAHSAQEVAPVKVLQRVSRASNDPLVRLAASLLSAGADCGFAPNTPAVEQAFERVLDDARAFSALPNPLEATAVLACFKRTRALQDQARFDQALVCVCAQADGDRYQSLAAALAAAQAVDVAPLQASGLQGAQLGDAIAAARVEAVAAALKG